MDQAELENQIVLRMPEGPAGELRELIRNPAINLKDRLRLQLDVELRRGTLYFDHYVFPCKLVDMPCVIEAQKSIDNKNIYKTADICQMLLCMEEEEPEEEPKPPKKSSSLKVDKRFLWPHGVTFPLKSVRKRRFRRTLKKKQYSDQPEIEKEVRRLLRADYEAGQIRWEVIDDEQEDKSREAGGDGKDAVIMEGSKINENPGPGDNGQEESFINAEQIFGEDVSDSDIDDDDIMRELDDESRSRLSMEMDDSQSRLSDSLTSASQVQSEANKSSFNATSFKDIFAAGSPGSSIDSSTPATPTPTTPTSIGKSPEKSKRESETPSRPASGMSSTSKEDIQAQLSELRSQLAEIVSRRQTRESELSTLENVTLRNRLESVLKQVENEQKEKEKQIRDLEAVLN